MILKISPVSIISIHQISRGNGERTLSGSSEMAAEAQSAGGALSAPAIATIVKMRDLVIIETSFSF
jgi:hypothetical protein